MDAQTVRRMIEQDVLDNHTRATHPGHGKAIENLKRIEHTETRTNAERRKPSVAGVITYASGKPVRAKTAGQVAYVAAIETHTITFGIGPAGHRQDVSWPSPKPYAHSRIGRCVASFSPVLPLKRGRASVFCPER